LSKKNRLRLRQGFGQATTRALRGRLDEFKGFFGDMKVDDVVEIDLLPGEGTRVAINGREKGVVQGDDFARAVLGIWLGPVPPSEELKEGMLGK
jgi:hypothetical protein